MQKVLEQVSDEAVRAYIIWLPMLPTDNRDQAEQRTSEFSDPRISYYWDGDRLTGALFQRVLDIPRVAWDVYLIYDEDAQWSEDSPIPHFWMHQLRGVSQGSYLDRGRFVEELKKTLN